jgi:hypothetical protein
LPAGVARVAQDRGDRLQRPRLTAAVSVAVSVGTGGAGNAAVVEVAGDAGEAASGQPLREHPPHMRRGLRVRFEAVQTPTPAGVEGVRVWAGVDEAVAVRWAAAQMSALVAGLGPHRGDDAEPCAEDLAFGLDSQQHHQRHMGRVVDVDRAVEFGQPQLHAVTFEDRRHLQELLAVEGAFVLADHDRVELAVRVSDRCQEGGGVGSVGPGQAA